MDSSSSVRFDFTVKLIVLGDQNVGKSYLLRQLAACGSVISARARCLDYRPNGHVELEISRNGKRIMAKIVDTGGQERFRSITASFYRGSQGCLLLFDAEKRDTFYNVHKWHTDLEYYTSKQPMITFLVGVNMQSSKRQISPDQADRLASQLELPLHEWDLSGTQQGQTAIDIVNAMLDYIVVHASRLPSLTITVMPQEIREHLAELHRKEHGASRKFQCAC